MHETTWEDAPGLKSHDGVARWLRALARVAAVLWIPLLAVDNPAAAKDQEPARRPPRPLTLARLVDPSTRVEVNGRLVQVALHGLIRFETLADLFTYVDEQSGRWTFQTAQERQAFGDDQYQR